MKVKIEKNPNILREAALLVYRGVNYSEDKLEVFENREIFNSLNLKDKEFFEKYEKSLNEMLENVSHKLKGYDDIKRYINIKSDTNKNGYLSSVIMINKADKIEDLSLDNFKKASIYNLLTYNNDSRLDYIYDEIDADIDKFINLDYVFEVLEGLDISLEEKYTYLEYFKNIEEIFKEYKEMLEIAIKVYESHYHNFEEYLDLVISSYELDDKTVEEHDFNDFLISSYINIKDIEEKIDKISYCISIVEYNSISIYISEENRFKARCIEGALYVRLNEILNHKEEINQDIEKKLVAIGDSTRIKIINMLHEKSYYAKEISEKLKLSPSTVSHHIEILLNNEVIKIKVEGRRVYYSLNKESMLILSKIFKKYGGD